MIVLYAYRVFATETVKRWCSHTYRAAAWTASATICMAAGLALIATIALMGGYALITQLASYASGTLRRLFAPRKR